MPTSRTNLTDVEFTTLVEFASKRPVEVSLDKIVEIVADEVIAKKLLEETGAALILELIRKGCMMIQGSNGKAHLYVTAQGVIELDHAHALTLDKPKKGGA